MSIRVFNNSNMKNIWVVSIWYYFKYCCSKHMWMCLFENMYSFLLDMYVWVDLLEDRVCVYSTLLDRVKQFFKNGVINLNSWMMSENFNLSTTWLTLGIFLFLMVTILVPTTPNGNYSGFTVFFKNYYYLHFLDD